MNPFEFLYYLGLSAKKIYSLRKQRHLPCKVISIGNITVGGTGKTPAAISVAEEALRRGLHPVILTRGYTGRAKGRCFVTRGEGPLLSVEDAGDEPFLMAERLKGVPIVKGPDRYEAGMFALQEMYPNSKSGSSVPHSQPIPNPQSRTPIFILDDGFQHWSLHRDKDIVLIDGQDPFGNGMLLPFGRLREPVGSMSRADIVVVTKMGEGEVAPPDLIKEIKRHNPGAPVFFAGHKPVSCRPLSGEKRPLSSLYGAKVFGFCGLGNPGSFKTTILSTGADLLGFKTFRDHYQYKNEDMRKIREEAEKSGAVWIVTTEKDIIKIRNLDLPENILIIEVAFSAEDGFFEEVFKL